MTSTSPARMDDFADDLAVLWSTPSDELTNHVDWAELGYDPLGVDPYTREALSFIEPPAPRLWRQTAHDYQLAVAQAKQAYVIFQAGRGCVAPWTRIYLPGLGQHERIDVLAARGESIRVLSEVDGQFEVHETDGAPFAKGYAHLWTITTDDGSEITVTDQHRFRTPEGWTRAAGMRAGQQLGARPSNDSAMTWQRIATIAYSGYGPYFDMTVPGPENYVAEGLVNHNSGKTHCASNVLVEWIEAEPGDYAIIAPTFGDAVTICADGPSGFIKAAGDLVERFNRNEYVIYMKNGSRVRLASADAPDRVRGWNFTGAWCIAEGEPVQTARGAVPVENVRPGDQVMTRQGWRRVTAAVRTKQDAPTLRIRTEAGSLRCTSDHPVWVVGRGWVLAGLIVPGDLVSSREPMPVLSVEDDTPSDVYDLTVDGAHEFYAGTAVLLVHNCDETGSWKDPTVWYEGLEFALRIGSARRVVTTTPRRGNKILKELAKRVSENDPDVLLVKASTRDNAANLSASFLRTVEQRYAGTTLGRQELDGELLNDVDGALVTTDLIDRTRIAAADIPDLWRVVVGVDPAVSNNEGSDHTGIIVMGIGPAPAGWQPPLGKVVLAGTAHLYLLHDASIKASAETWARHVLEVAEEWSADAIVGEKNNGGDLVELTVRMVAEAAGLPVPNYIPVSASVGKKARAEPVVGVWEQHRLHIMREASGGTEKFEEEVTTWVSSETKKSPDRLDSGVWSACALMPELSAKGQTRIRLLSAAG